MPNMFMLILQIALVLAICRVVGSVFIKLHQPRVMGEMCAGIMLGPSLLGWIAPRFSAFLFQPASLGYLSALSQVGVVVFMFLVGLGINPKALKNQGHTAILTSHVSITLPFVLASFLAIYLYPRLSDNSVPFIHFALFMGAAMSITAFPVLARILAERKLLQSRLGTVAIACAAVDDVTGWCVLAYIVLLVRATGAQGRIWLTIGGLISFTLIMLFVVQRLVGRFEVIYRETGRLSENAITLMVLLFLGSALCTESLGIHLLFGSFLMEAIMPKDARFVRYVRERFEIIVGTLLLPLFFAFIGLRTNIGLVKGWEMWGYCILILLVATVGKFGGSMLAAWWTGMPVREAAGVGTLMNTRGLMELVVLNIGLDIKVISPALFSMMVLMALVTTFMTSLVLEAICPDKILKVEAESIAEEPAADSDDCWNSSAVQTLER
jgi:Kef-type K+ transport system membrane component KefB